MGSSTSVHLLTRQLPLPWGVLLWRHKVPAVEEILIETDIQKYRHTATDTERHRQRERKRERYRVRR